MKTRNRNKIIIFVLTIAIILIIGILFFSYGFLSSRVSNNISKKNSYLNQVLSVEYSDNTAVLTSNQEGHFIPGATLEKTFTIENTGNVEVSYSINLTDVVNTYNRYNEIVYEITSTDNTINKTASFPKTDDYIIREDTLEVGKSRTYNLIIKYLSSTENQIEDSGKSLSAKLTINEKSSQIKKLKIYGNSIQDGTPTIDTPVEIKTLGDKTSGNLYNKDLSAIDSHNLTLSIIDMTDSGIKITSKKDFGTSTFLAFRWLLADVKDYVGKRITVSFDFTSSGQTGRAYLMTMDATGGVSGYNILEEDEIKPGTNVTITSIPITQEMADNTNNPYIGLILLHTDEENTKAGSFVNYDNLKIYEGIYDEKTINEIEENKYRIPIQTSSKNLVRISDLNHIPGTADQIDYTDDYIIGEISRIAENSNPGEGNWGNGWLSYHAILNPNTTYTVSYDIEFLTMPEGKSSVRHSIFNRNDTSNRRYVTVSELNKKYSNSAVFTSDEYGGIYMIFTVNSSKVKISNFQVEEGTQKTEYEKSTAYRDYIYLDEPLRKIGDCETCADYIDFENKKVVRNTRSVRYKVSEMSNSENYPGWKNQTIFIEDFPNQNKQLHQITSFKSNISDNIGIGINTNSMGIVWLEKSYFGKTQTEYLNNYSDLEVNIIYKTQASNTTETFEMPDLVAPRQSNIRVCDDKNVCASNIEVEYE